MYVFLLSLDCLVNHKIMGYFYVYYLNYFNNAIKKVYKMK